MIELVVIYLGITFGWWAIESSRVSHDLYLDQCVSAQVDLYGDLCAESSTGYEDMAGTEAHFEGARCAAESIQACVEGYQ